jgi:hypothetical protein
MMLFQKISVLNQGWSLSTTSKENEVAAAQPFTTDKKSVQKMIKSCCHTKKKHPKM